MKYKLSLYQRMLQKMSLTPQMRQSIQLLSMPTTELNEFIETLIEKNPLLKKENKNKPPKTSRSDISTSFDYDKTKIAHEENPRLSLLSQLRMLDLSNKILEISEYLIYEMDDNGYIKINIEEAAEDLFVSAEEIEEALAIIQRMDPAGIGARDVRECLSLQLKRMGKKDSLEYTIVNEFINDLATNDVNKIAGALKIDEDKVISAINNIRKMNPRPAASMLTKDTEYITPDLIARIKDKDLKLELNRDWIPRLKLYNPYKNKLDIIKDQESRDFLKKNMDEAKQLIDNLKRREETMCRVADFILNFQKDYLKDDITQLNSLTIKDVAEALNLHPSTISRTVSNKYIQINNKVIPLKVLLSHGIKKENGELTSKTSVKNRIKHLIDKESKNKPLTDNAIKEVLELEGIAIKRRTVAKYRDSLKILPTHLRKHKNPIKISK